MWQWIKKLWARPLPAERLGNSGENLAAEYLERQGFQILERQWRSRFGELDLVAVDSETIVFVEVKTRATMAAGDPTEAITRAKQKKITQSALAYLKRRGWLQRRSRIDVVSILWQGQNGQPDIRHYRSAFDATGFGQMYS